MPLSRTSTFAIGVAVCLSSQTYCLCLWRQRHRVERRPHHLPRRPRDVGESGPRHQRRRAGGGIQPISQRARLSHRWSGGNVIDLGGLPGRTNNQATASTCRAGGGASRGGVTLGAAEWSGGTVIDLGGLLGSTDSYALAINDAGQVVGSAMSAGTPLPPSGASAPSSTLAVCPGAQTAMPMTSITPGR